MAWVKVKDIAPPQMEIVSTMDTIQERVSFLVLKGNVWFKSDFKTPAGYTPTHWWRYVD